MAARKTFPPLRPARERFMENVQYDAATGCLLWTGGVGSHGYGVFYAGRRRQELAHRFALAKRLGRPIGPGLEALHDCDRPLCVSWDHLTEGTHAQNMAGAAERGRSVRPSELIVACAQGHDYTPENTLWKTRRVGGREYRVRICRECNRIACRQYRADRKAA